MTTESEIERFDINPVCAECPWINSLVNQLDQNVLEQIALNEKLREFMTMLEGKELTVEVESTAREAIEIATAELEQLQQVEAMLRSRLADKSCAGEAKGELTSPQGIRFLAVTCASALRQRQMKRIGAVQPGGDIARHGVDDLVDTYIIPFPEEAEH